MATQYDSIGARYGGMHTAPAITGPDIERPSVQAVLGDITGLHCLDLACGYGRWMKFLLENHAASVTGVDISSAMIDAAKAASATWPVERRDKAAFHVGDCSKVIKVPGGPFDVVFAVWFLNYAADAEELTGMWRNIYANLKPGGRFIGITTNVHLPFETPVTDQYGIAVEPLEKVKDGWKCRLTAYTEPERVTFDIYHLSKEAYENGAEAAGMTDVEWRGHTLPEDDRKYSGYWDAYVERPQMEVVTAKRPQ